MSDNNDLDISHTIVAKSDQLNADDLVAGPITVQITGVSVNNSEQPVVIALSGGHKPWKPCKTARRLLIFGWGENAREYVGKWITLYRDPAALWANKEVGGIRPSAMSDIQGAFTLPLAYAKAKKSEYKVAVLRPPTQVVTDPALAAFTRELVAATKTGGWNPDQVRALLTMPAAEVPVEKRAEIVALLKSPPAVDDKAAA